VSTVSRNPSNEGDLRLISESLRNLKTLHKGFLTSELGSKGSRQEPVVILLRGPPGVGKSVAMEHLNNAFCAKTLPPEMLSSFKKNITCATYNRQHENKYWDGFKKTTHTVFFDDFAQAKDIAGEPDNEYMNLIRLANGFPVKLHTANMEDKGNLEFHGKAIFCSTNVRGSFKCESIIDMGALNRRFDLPYVVVPKEEYTLSSTVELGYYERKLDPSKLPRGTLHLPNGDVDVSTLTPDVLQFLPCDSKGVVIGESLTFKEVITKLLVLYKTKENRYLMNKQDNVDTLYEYQNMHIPGFDTDYESADDEDSNSVNSGDSRWPGCSRVEPQYGYEDAKSFFRSCYVEDRVKPEDYSGMFEDHTERFATEFENEEDDPEVRVRLFSGEAYGKRSQDLDWRLLLRILIRDFGLQFYERIDKNLPLSFRVLRIPHYRFVPRALEFLDSYTSYLDNWLGGTSLGYLYVGFKSIVSNKAFIIMAASLAAAVLGFSAVREAMKIPFQTFYPEVPENSVEIPLLDTGEVSLITGHSHGSSDRMKVRQKSSYSQFKKINNLKPTPQVGTSFDKSGQDLVLAIVSRNTYTMVYQGSLDKDKMGKMGYVTFVRGRFALVPRHFMKVIHDLLSESEEAWDFVLEFYKNEKERSTGFKCSMGELYDLWKDPESMQDSDMTIIEFPKYVHGHRDITNNFVNEITVDKLPPVFPVSLHFPEGVYRIWQGNAQVFSTPVHVTSKEIGSYDVVRGFQMMAGTSAGDCGALLTLINPAIPNGKILGFHVAGAPGVGVSYSNRVSSEKLHKALDVYGSTIVPEEVPVDRVALPHEIVAQGQFSMIGFVNKFPSRNMKTSLVRSQIDFKEPTEGYAQLRDFYVGSDRISPLDKAQLKYCKVVPHISSKLLYYAMNSLENYLISTEMHCVRKCILSVGEVLNGVELEVDMKGIPSSTSAGYPMNVNGNRNLKKEYYCDDALVKARALCDIEMEVSKLLGKAAEGIRVPNIFTDALKDERRPLDRIIQGSTRMFSGCPFIYQVSFRMYFGSFLQYITQNGIQNGCAIGVNPYSEEWALIALKLSAYDSGIPQVGAGDFAGYDGSCIPQIHTAILDIINTWYDDGNDLIREVLWQDVVNSVHVVDGKIFEWSSSLPSGHPGTIVINCLYNHLAFRLCWQLAGLDIYEFNEKVYVIIMGDDNVFSVDQKYREQFNEMKLPGLMSQIGMTYTTELKGSAVTPFRDISNVEFLKRRFRLDPVVGRYVAPLRLETVLEIPLWTKKGMLRDAIVASNVTECLFELSLHEKETYDEWEPLVIASFLSKYPGVPTPRLLKMRYRDRQATQLGCDSTY
jgi:hypothetical protein